MATSPPPPKLSPDWARRLAPVLLSPAMLDLDKFLTEEATLGRPFCPPRPLIFSALNATSFDSVRVVILGQDPYHGLGQAHGLAFSVQPGVRIPPSLHNIFLEQQSDLGLPTPAHGCLLPWAHRGVLLLNAVLTVRLNQPASHQGRGWEGFTDHIITLLNQREEPLVFLLWGRYARSKAVLVNNPRHLVLQAAHPSPLSARNGFFGCRHFSLANHFLRQHNLPVIDWSLPPKPDVGKLEGWGC